MNNPEGVAFAVVLVVVGAIPGIASLVIVRVSHRVTDHRLAEILAILRGRQAKRPVGYELTSTAQAVKKGEAS